MHVSKGVQKIKLSKKFQEICVKIGDCKSREEEEEIVSKWMERVKTNLNKSNLKISQLYENVISLVHLTLLGYDTTFGQINAVNLTQDTQMMTKALGYLACSAILDSQSSLLILIINSTQRDLSSQHPTSMALALTAICHLVTADLIPSVINFVSQCLQHNIALIRQKAIMCIHSFAHKDPSCVVDFFPELVRLLSDSDLSIVNSIVLTFISLLEKELNIRQICETLPDIINTVMLIQQGQARTEYYHQRFLAPFVLVNIYTLFQKMAPQMPELGNEIAQILTFSLQNGTTECSATSCVLYEAVRTCIACNLINIPQLRGAISLFMGSEDQNYIYVGLGLLSAIPDFADEFQDTVIDCLNHPDATIRLRTLGLLHAMANESNSQIIIVNMLKFFQKTKNENIRIELADRITSIASKYSPSPIWFAKTMEQLFSIGGDQVRPEVAFAIMDIVDVICDEEMKKSIVNLYIDVAQSGKRLSNVFVIIIAKIIGEYADLSDEYDLNFIALLLCDLCDAYEEPRFWILNALLEVSSKLDKVPQQVSDVFENYKHSKSIIVQEICYESTALLNYIDDLKGMIENITKDRNKTDRKEFPDNYDQELTFLDDFVQDAIENKGAREYIPLDQREADLNVPVETKQLKFTYQQPASTNNYEESLNVPPGGGPYGPQESQTQETEDQNNALDLTGVKMVWGETGVHQEYENQGADAQVENGDSYYSQQQEKPVSMFERLKIQKTPGASQEDVQRKKMAKSLFGNKKSAPASQEPSGSIPTANGPYGNQPPVNGPYGNTPINGPYGNQPPVSGPYGNQPPVSGPYGNQPIVSGPYGNPPSEPTAEKLNMAGVAPQVYGSPDKMQISEQDYQLIERVSSEINSPPPQPIQDFINQGGEFIDIYKDNQLSVSVIARNATILLCVTNINPKNPMINVSISLEGAEGLESSTITHPQTITAIPNMQAVLSMSKYKFPQQMKSFPEFIFTVTVNYNKTRKAQFQIKPQFVSLATFITPFQATTPQFGQMWTHGGTELILTIDRTDPSISLDFISHLMNQVVHAKTVQRIGMEEIFCGMLVTTPFKVLIHVKFGSEKIDIKLLTKAPALTRALFELLKSLILK
ncbi:hypothetical protein M9Y10_011952 [Tritrichomonas musculus]|uniref:AP-4 complex subunit epsilon-1 C-terminal domain-containing protein n=1 Tax=Tritrichomonas musculus TaxID=1915356 RepID=A0ABR2IBC0_9EUKA